MVKRFKGEILLSLGALFFAFNGVVAKWVLESGVNALRMTQVRSTGAFIFLFFITLAQRGSSLKATRKELPTLIFFGIFGFAAVQGFYLYSIARLHVSVALIIEFTAPIWIALYLRFIRKKAVARSMWVGLLFGFGGLLLLAQVWQGLTLDGLGVLSSFADAFALVIYFLMAKELGKKRTGGEMITWGLGVTTVVLAIALPWWSFPFDLFSRSIELNGRFAGHHLPGWVLLSWVIIFGTVLPYVCVANGVRATTASKGSIIGMLEPVLAGIFAWIALGEKFNVIQLIGAAVVLIGIVVADRATAIDE